MGKICVSAIPGEEKDQWEKLLERRVALAGESYKSSYTDHAVDSVTIDLDASGCYMAAIEVQADLNASHRETGLGTDGRAKIMIDGEECVLAVMSEVGTASAKGSYRKQSFASDLPGSLRVQLTCMRASATGDLMLRVYGKKFNIKEGTI